MKRIPNQPGNDAEYQDHDAEPREKIAREVTEMARDAEAHLRLLWLRRQRVEQEMGASGIVQAALDGRVSYTWIDGELCYQGTPLNPEHYTPAERVAAGLITGRLP